MNKDNKPNPVNKWISDLKVKFRALFRKRHKRPGVPSERRHKRVADTVNRDDGPSEKRRKLAAENVNEEDGPLEKRQKRAGRTANQEDDPSEKLRKRLGDTVNQTDDPSEKQRKRKADTVSQKDGPPVASTVNEEDGPSGKRNKRAADTVNQKDGPSDKRGAGTANQKDGPSEKRGAGTANQERYLSEKGGAGTANQKDGPSDKRGAGTANQKDGPSDKRGAGTANQERYLSEKGGAGTVNQKDGPSEKRGAATANQERYLSEKGGAGTANQKDGPSDKRGAGTANQKDDPSDKRGAGTANQKDGPSEKRGAGTQSNQERYPSPKGGPGTVVQERYPSERRQKKNQKYDSEDSQDDDLKSENSKIFQFGPRGLNGSEDEEIVPRPPTPGKMLSVFHIGRLAKECLCRGFNIGVWELECSTGSKDYFSTYTFGKADPDLNTVSGSVGLTQQYGMFTLGQAWKTDGFLGLIGLDTEQLGAKFYSIFSAHSVKNEGATAKIDLLAGFERSPFKSEVIVPLFKSPKFLGYFLVEPLEHFILACRMEFNVEDRAIDAHAFCVGYSDDTTEYGLKLENFKDVRGSVFQRLGDKWGVALKANLFGKDMKKFTVGGQYQLNDKALIKARICDDGLTGLVYQIKLNDNVEGNYYFGFDATSPLKGEHKIGIAWRFRG